MLFVIRRGVEASGGSSSTSVPTLQGRDLTVTALLGETEGNMVVARTRPPSGYCTRGGVRSWSRFNLQAKCHRYHIFYLTQAEQGGYLFMSSSSKLLLLCVRKSCSHDGNKGRV